MLSTILEPFKILAPKAEFFELGNDCNDEISVSGGTNSLSIETSIWGSSSSSSKTKFGDLGLWVGRVGDKEEKREEMGKWLNGTRDDGLRWVVKVLGFRGRRKWV